MGQDTEFDLGDIEPTPVLWRVMDLQPAQQAPCLFGRECFVERPPDVHIEVATDRDHLLCIGIVHIEEVLHLVRSILLGSCFGQVTAPAVR